MTAPGPSLSLGTPKGTAMLTHRQVLVMLSGLMLTMLLAILDQTIVATALPTIASDLGGVDHISWVPTSYLLMTTLSAPLYGKISDLFGRKRLYQTAIVVFLIGSALSGLSANMTELIVFRALQGLGGGGLMSLSFAIVGDILSPRERGRYQGYFGAISVLGSLVGPLAGGLFAQDLSWRWIFYINLPIGAAALAVTSVVLRLPLSTREPVLDYAGAGLMCVTVVGVLGAMTLGGTSAGWGSPAVLVLFGVGATALVALGRVERRAREPVFPPRVFLRSIPATASALTFLFAAGQFAAVVYLPIYLQLADGVAPATSGLLILPLMTGTVTASIVSGRLMSRYGRYKVFPICGSVLMTIGMVGFSRLTTSTSHLATSAVMVVFGLGLGMGPQLLITVVQNAVEPSDIGVASSSMSFFRNFGAAFGTAIFGTVLVARLDHFLPLYLPGIHVTAGSASALANPARLARLPRAIRAGVTEAFVHSLHAVFLAGLPMLLVACGLALSLREIPLGSRSAHARAAEKRRADGLQPETAAGTT